MTPPHRAHAQPALLTALLLLLAGCGGDAGEGALPEPVVDTAPVVTVSFDSGAAVVVTEGRRIPITVELADSEEQRSFGLMERTTLAEDHGMLFRYDTDQPGAAGFWMYRTLIPLDIAFLDGDGTILAVLQMDPCRSMDPAVCGTETYAPGVAYRDALEMRRGWFSAQSVGVGDRVMLEEGAKPGG